MKRSSKRERNRNIFISIIIAGILISSVLAFIYGGDMDENEFEYNINDKTYTFGKSFNKYYLDINNDRIFFYNLPDQIDINLSSDISERIINSQMFYITFNPEEEELSHIDLARFELSNEFFKNNIYIVNAVTVNSTDYELPVIDCENATMFVPVIKLVIGDKNLTVDNNCVIFQGKGLDFVKFRDLLIYKLYEVY